MGNWMLRFCSSRLSCDSRVRYGQEVELFSSYIVVVSPTARAAIVEYHAGRYHRDHS
jgi:hypothetical protein